MKRELIYNDGTPIPFVENLIFYAPLDYNDTSDHISGVIPIQHPNTNISWDSQKNMYLLESNPRITQYYVSPLYYQVNLDVFIGYITMVIDIINVELGANRYSAHFITPSWSDIAKNYQQVYIRQNNYGSMDNNIHRYAVVAHFEQETRGVCNFYKDGVYVNNSVWGGDKQVYPTNTVSICMANDTTSAFKIYAKNARIYNRRMTAQEISQL